MIIYKWLGLAVLAAVLGFGLMACGGHSRANLNQTDVNIETELRENWESYIVYRRDRGNRSSRPGLAAMLYQVKGKTIQKDRQWVEIASSEELANARVIESPQAAEILGKRETVFGYLIFVRSSGVSVKIVDEQTVRLSYQYVRTYSLW